MAETLADNSDNASTIPDNGPTNPDNASTIPDNGPTNPDEPPAEEAPAPEQERPKTRGRPFGSKNSKPRIRRVPVVIEQQEEPAAAPAATKRVQIAEPAEEPAQPEPPRKSPRTLHREHVQALAAEQRALAQAKQAHFESMFDRNLSW